MSSLVPLDRRLRTILFIGFLVSTLVACVDAAPPSQVPATPPAASGAVPADPGAAIDVQTLLGDAATKDGQAVRVTGNFLADDATAQLCQVLMESYPPQCGGGVRLTGSVPADTLARFTTTTEPGLKKMWWGFVTVTGTFHAAGADGKPSIELGEIVLIES